MEGRQREEEEGHKIHVKVWRLERMTHLGNKTGGLCGDRIEKSSRRGKQEAGHQGPCESSRECEL